MGALFDVARYLTELSALCSTFAFTCKTSVTAYSSILCALDALQTSPLPLPYDYRVAFLNNMAQVTGLYPSDAQVIRVCQKLKDLCPAMFDGQNSTLPAVLLGRAESYAEVEPKEDDGKTSPVCVVTTTLNESSTTRKRGRCEEAASHNL
jgi:hypothetical protein